MYYLGDTRDLVNNSLGDYATYMFNFDFSVNNFCTIYQLCACTCVCIILIC